MATIIIHQENSFILRFDKGEDVFVSLIQFCKKNKINAGWFTGLGACGNLTLSYYDLANKSYLDKQWKEELEIVSLTGNVATLNKEVALHAHGVFSDKSYKTYGGHVKKLVVSATCEIHLTTFEKSINRALNQETGLNLLTED